jgi:Dockerin type I domain
LGDGNNTGGRSFATTPFGLYMGTARSIGGTQTFMLDNTNLDFNQDGTIDRADVNLMQARVNSTAKPNDPMDLDRDGKITSADVELLKTQCTYPGCAAPAERPATATLTAPVLYSAPGTLASGAPVSLSWNAVSGAYDYLVYRIAVSGSESTPPPAAGNSVADACRGAAAANLALCSRLAEARGTTTNPLFGYPGQPTLLKRVATPAYSELAPNSLQSLYFVRAEDASGDLSPPSNVAGGPSLAAQ